MSTLTHTAGAVTLLLFITHNHRGTSALHQLKMSSDSRENAATNWYPETIKTGRYGDWLNNNIDWALSRNRYWGTPLPIWRCENKHEVCVESLADLGARAGQELSALDPHRPFVDDITFACTECSETMNRVPEVIDCWYDSGAMPFAQWGYPHQEGSRKSLKLPILLTLSAKQSIKLAAGSTH